MIQGNRSPGIASRVFSIAGAIGIVRGSIACAIGSLFLISTAAADPLLDTIAADVAVAVQIERPGRLFPPDQLSSLMEKLAPNAAMARKFEAAVRKCPGRVVLALVPATEMQKEMITDFAIEAGPGEGGVDDWVEKSLLPAIDAIADRAGSARLEKTATIRRIIDARRDDHVVVYAVRDGVVFGSTRPQRVQQWLRGEFPERKWAQLPGSRRTLSKLSKEFAVRAIFNPEWLRQQLGKPQPGSVQEILHGILHPDDLQSAVLEIHWSRADLSAQLTLALATPCHGMARALQQTPTESAAIGAFPDDFVAVGRLAMPSLAAVADGIYALTDRFDPTIGREYREDLDAFASQTGVDWNNDIAANVAGEIAFGLRVDFTQFPPIGWAVVCPLADEAKFLAAFDKLIDHFKLPLKSARHEDLPMHIGAASPPLAIAVAAGRLIVADGPRTAAQLARAAAGARPASQNLRPLYRELGEANQLALLVDLGVLRQKAPMALLAMPPALGRLLGEGAIGMTLTRDDDLTRLKVQWSLRGGGGERMAKRLRGADDGQSPGRDDGADADGADGGDGPGVEGGVRPAEGAEAAATLIAGLISSGRAARIQAQKAVSSQNMRSVGMAMHTHAQAHKGAFPPDLATLLRDNNVALEQFRNPYTGEMPAEPSAVGRDSYLIYRPGLSTSSHPDEIVLAEREPMAGGAHFLFVDSHVEFIAEPRASELIALMQQGAAEIRR